MTSSSNTGVGRKINAVGRISERASLWIHGRNIIYFLGYYNVNWMGNFFVRKTKINILISFSSIDNLEESKRKLPRNIVSF